jgi:hypothetical protein
MFINEHILKKAPVRAAEGLEGLESINGKSKGAPVEGAPVEVAPVKDAKKVLAGEDALFKKIEAQNESIKKMQGQLMKETETLGEFAKRED